MTQSKAVAVLVLGAFGTSVGVGMWLEPNALKQSSPRGTADIHTESASAKAARAKELVRTYSVVSLHNRRLDACIDFVVRIEAPEGLSADFLPEPPADLQRNLAKLGTEIHQPCLDEFARASVLATCVATARRDGQTLQLVERYYDYTTVGVDETRMEECLRLGGEWQAIGKNSPEFLHAKRTAIVQDLEAMAQGS